MTKTLPPSNQPDCFGRTTMGDAVRSEVVDTEADENLDPRIVAMLPAEVLQPGEIVVLLLKPSAWYIVLEPLRTLIVMVLVVAVALMLQSRTGMFQAADRDLILAGMLVVGLRLVWQFLEWYSRWYVLTDRRVIRVQGVFRISLFETALKHVQHTQAYFSLRERFFGLGTIGFSTAGTGATEAYWRMIAKPMEVHRVIVQTLNRYR